MKIFRHIFSSRAKGSFKSVLSFSLSIILLLTIATGCIKNKFKVEFNLDKQVNSAYTLSYYASSASQGLYVESAVSINNGKGETELATRFPTVVILSSGAESIYFYAERGDDISITGQSADPLGWNVSGNSINEDWSRWRIENIDALRSRDAVKVNEAVEKFVKKDNENPLSTLLLIYYYDRRKNNNGFLRLWKSLKGDAAKEKWLTITSRNDLLTAEPLPQPNMKKPHTLILKSRENGADTVVTGTKTVVLYFWRTGDPDHDLMIDSLKSLRKSHPDSASFVIADICFNPDSMSWSGAVGRDSLYHTIRAWNPVAEADSAIKALGVERTPLLITINPIKKK